MKKALVLSGGGSLGAYEIGAWYYFREKGITFDIVTGTSIGAINGATYVSGDFDTALKLWETITASQVFEHGFSITSKPLQSFMHLSVNEMYGFFKSYAKKGGVDISPFMELLEKYIDPVKVKESPITFGVVVTLFKGRQEKDIVMQEQPTEKILDYLHASSACWPMFPIYKIDGTSYIDGGYTNNLPIDFALKLGADEITAVVLKAVPKEPQHPQLLTLPNVTTIRASHDTGFIMDFHPEMIRQNMSLGYLDARKTYGDAWGFEYAFEKDKLTEERAKSCVTNAIKVEPRDIELIRHAMVYANKKPHTYLDYFIRALEMMGSWFKIDYLTCHSIPEFEAIIREKTRETLLDPKTPKKFAEFKANPSAKKVDRKILMALMYKQTKEGIYSPELIEIMHERPNLRIVLEFFRYWKAAGLLID